MLLRSYQTSTIAAVPAGHLALVSFGSRGNYMAVAMEASARKPLKRMFLFLGAPGDHIEVPRVLEVPTPSASVLDLGPNFYFDFTFTGDHIRLRENDIKHPIGSIAFSGNTFLMAAATSESTDSSDAVFVDLQTGCLVERPTSPGSVEVCAWTLMLPTGMDREAPVKVAQWRCHSDRDEA